VHIYVSEKSAYQTATAHFPKTSSSHLLQKPHDSETAVVRLLEGSLNISWELKYTSKKVFLECNKHQTMQTCGEEEV
jgi:hypothetical protein